MPLSNSAYRLLKYVKKNPGCTESSLEKYGERALRELLHNNLIESDFVVQDDSEEHFFITDFGYAYFDTLHRELARWAFPVVISIAALAISGFTIYQNAHSIDVNILNPQITITTPANASAK